MSDTPSPRIKAQRRLDKKALIGDDYEEVVKDVPQPPYPYDDPEEYGYSQVKYRLQYADHTLRHTERRLPPIGQQALTMYKDACGRLLGLLEEGKSKPDETGDEEVMQVKEEWISVIRTYDRAIQYTACLQLPRTDDEQKLQDQIVSL